jgi:gluconate 2-dehydrogenase gamma chain
VSERISRRTFLRSGSLYGAGLALALQLPRPRAVAAAAASSEPATFSDHEWKTVEAISGRIVPTDGEPGAIEALCVNFIDKALANEDAAARPLYTAGIAGVDAVARERFGRPFTALEAAPQDEILAALERGDAPGWPGDVPAPLFFETLRVHTLVGFLADPKYGGNRDHAGWRVTGYPGPRHRLGGYTPDQVTGREAIRPIWQRES